MDAMKLLLVRALRGANLWSDATAIQADVSSDPNQLDIVLERAVAFCPGMLVPKSGSPALRAAHGLGEVTCQLQVEAGTPVELIRVVGLATKTDARLVFG